MNRLNRLLLTLLLFTCTSFKAAPLSPSSASKPKRALVTGGAGFIGSHLSERLLEEGYDVICFDNLSSGEMFHIASLMDNPHFEFIYGDVRVPFDPGPIEEIYNLACVASPGQYQLDPVKTFLTNILGAYHVLEIAKKYGASVFQASTSEIYGDPLEHPQKESYWGNVHTIGPRACYDEGKRGAETLFFDTYRTYGIPIKVARIFNTYGPHMSIRDGRVISNFILQALNDDPISIYGTGLQTRSFCYCQDLIDAIRAFMQTEKDFTGPINLGNPVEFTILELAQKIIEMIGSNSQIILKSPLEDDPKRRCPDIALATEKLKWVPKVPLEQGLSLTIDYFKSVAIPEE